MAEDDIYETTFDLTYAGQNIASVFHFKQLGDDGAGDARDSINLMFVNEFLTEYLEGLSDQLVAVGLRTRKILPDETQALTVSNTDTGTVTGQGLPPNQVGIIREYGPLLQAIPPLRGTRGIGRVLISGIPEEDVKFGRLNVDQITFRDAFATKLNDDQVDGTTTYIWHAVVLSRVDDIGREINQAGILTQVKNLRSRTRSA